MRICITGLNKSLPNIVKFFMMETISQRLSETENPIKACSIAKVLKKAFIFIEIEQH